MLSTDHKRKLWREASRRYRASHLKQSRERVRVWNKANPEKVKIHYKTWQQKHRDQVNAYQRARYAKRRAVA